MYKFIISFSLIIMTIQCQSPKNNSTKFLELNKYSAKQLDNPQAKKVVNDMKESLYNILDVNALKNSFNKDNYVRESFSAIDQEAKRLGLKVEKLDSEYILLSLDNSYYGDSNIIFYPLYKSSDALSHIPTIISARKDENFLVTGYQSLLKGYLTSMMFALLQLEKEKPGQPLKILVGKTDNNISYAVENRVKKILGETGIFILPWASYNNFENMNGQIEWKIEIPQDSKWLIDIATKQEENSDKTLKVKFFEMGGDNNIKSEVLKELPINMSFEDYIKDPYSSIKNNNTKIISFIKDILGVKTLPLDLKHLGTASFIKLVEYLYNKGNTWKISDVDGKKIFLKNINIKTLKTSQEKIKIYLQAETSGDNIEIFSNLLKDFLEGEIFSIKGENNTLPYYKFQILKHQPEYSITSQELVQSYASHIKKSLEKWMNIPTYIDYMPFQEYPYSITPRILFLGSVWNNPENMSNVPYIRESKLYLDYQLLQLILSGNK